eukprot:GSChrysophyteH1.ASY1.ANO1.542.1 assembled CDS
MRARVHAAMKKRRNTNDKFRVNNGYSWDYVLAFPIYDDEQTITTEQRTWNTRRVLAHLASGGLQMRLFYNTMHNTLYCKIRASQMRLMKEAFRIGLRLQFDEEKLKEYCSNGRSDKGWGPMSIPDSTVMTKIPPFKYINAESSSEFENDEGFATVVHNSIFRGVDRLKLIDSIINNNTIGGCHLNIDNLMKNGCIVDYSCLHDQIGLQELENSWVKLFQFPWNQDTEIVKNYFGERIGLYFSWLGHYTTWLMLASVFGIAAWANVQADDGNPNAAIMPYFAGFMAIWGTLYLESWKRQEVRLAMEWGMTNNVTDEQDRPQFSGLKAISPITGAQTFYFPDHLRRSHQFYSYWIIFLTISLVIGCLATLFVIKAAIDRSAATAPYSSEIVSFLIAMQIEFLNYVFSRIAINLNEAENHRTDTAFENSLIGKTFVFQFINSFSGLFYVSFFKPFSEADRCNPKNCFYDLQATLGTIFMSRLFVHNYFKLVSPILMQQAALDDVKHIDAENDEEAAKHEVSEIERMYLLSEYDSMMGTFHDYSAMVSQFGYMTMFVSAFPLCTVLALANNYVQLRVDAWRLCQVVQRPDPKSAESIGKWQDVLELTGLVAVFTNSGLVSFTGQFVVSLQWPSRVWIFFLMSSGIICIKWLVAAIIPDVPNDVKIQQERNEYFLEKVIENKRDVQTTLEASSLRVRPNFKLKIGDDDPL